MRGLACVLLLAACSVPDKSPTTGDGGTDAMLPVDDNAVPDTMILESPPAFWNSGSSTFRFTASHANATFECSIDGDTPVPCMSPYTRALGDGSHVFSVRAINKYGMGDQTPAEHLWMIDTVAPSTMLTESPPAADNSTMVRFSFTSSEENVTFDCSLDSGAYAPCESGSEFGPVADGSHAFAVRAHDRAGNVDASPAIHAWSVDTSTPDTQLLSGPEGAVGSQTATFTFVSPDAGAGATFQCALDAGAMAACSSPFTLNNLPMGVHTFQVRVRDAVGNLDPTPATRTWTVDLDAPETTIDTGPMGLVRNASANFTFSSNEMNVTYACSLDSAPFAACTSPQSFTNLGQGAHTFSVRATDMANHTDATPATRTWTVDTIAPDVMITNPAEGATVAPRVAFAFTASEGTAECAVDAGAFAACTSPLPLNLAVGPHAFRVRASDAAGNITNATRNFTVACMPPDATGAAGLLHLDDTGQTLANAVAGGAAAVLGTTDQVEAVDPTLGAGRFGGAAIFAAGDVITWPAAIGALGDFTVELAAYPTPGDIFVASGLAIRATANGANVRIVAETADGSVTSGPVPASAWHHVLVSRSGGTLRMWVDGARTQAASAGAATLDAITLGGGSYGGAIDEVYVSPAGIADDEAALGRWCPM